ncbi:MAG: hypothetical protein IPK07_15460 [Deltaproteobacteria bacterium]|jgi:plastocyanin|nr:hypothetical protein [Deltaproteobacteria bacterium]
MTARAFRAWVAALVLVVASTASAAEPLGSISGTVRTALGATVPLANVGPVVVFLATPDRAQPVAVPADSPEISQKGARFEPPFLLITAGQTVRIPNDDSITHNAFSYSKPNAFDLGLYPKGDARTITVREPGAIRIFCSIHKSMNAVIFATPTPWHALAAADGRFRLADVPAGHYVISTWNERLPPVTAAVDVVAGEASVVSLTIPASGG